VLLVDDPDGYVEQFGWIEATDAITADNAAAKFIEQLPDAVAEYHDEKPREVLAVTGPHYHVPYDTRGGDEVLLPLDAETDDPYLSERVYWSEILLPADNAVPLWRIEWSATE
jgi:hypothetical protein